MLALREKPFLGKPLAKLPMTGDLSECRKIYFDQARHRIVYRLLPDEQNPVTADIIAVGPRAAAQVYADAVRRLSQPAATPNRS